MLINHKVWSPSLHYSYHLYSHYFSSGRGGQLRGDLRSSVGFDEFRRRLLGGLRDHETIESGTASTNTTNSPKIGTDSASGDTEAGSAAPATDGAALPGVGRVYPDPAIPQTPSASRLPLTQPPLSQPPSLDTHATLVERRQRLEADRLQREAQALAEQQARDVAQQEQQASKASRSPARASQISHARQERKRKQEARQERERILKIIESDKLERRHQSQLQRGYDDTRSSENVQKTSETTKTPAEARIVSSMSECALRVRLLDGSSINAKFPTSKNLHTHVRAWIDSERTDGDAPYSLKQILAPGKNGAIEVSAEMESLQVLGLVPNATLLMVPAKGVVAAYAPGARRGAIRRVVVPVAQAGAAIYAFIRSLLAVVTATLWTFLGIGNRTAPQRRDETADQEARKRVAEKRAESLAKTSGVAITGNVRTLRDRDERNDDRHFYNGNQVSIFISCFKDHSNAD